MASLLLASTPERRTKIGVRIERERERERRERECAWRVRES